MRRDFVGADVFGTFALPWRWYSESGWGVGTRLMTSAGAFSGVQKTAFVTSVVPLIALGAWDGTVTIDAGMGAALISVHHFDNVHNLGGPFQFVATLGTSVALLPPIAVGYRFQHYSDGTPFGTNTRGIDLHMIELT